MRRSVWLLTLALLSTLGSADLLSPASIQPAPVALTLTIDGVTQEAPLQATVDRHGVVYLRAVDLLATGLPMTMRESIAVNGQHFMPLRLLTGYAAHTDFANRRISLQLLPQGKRSQAAAQQPLAPFQGPTRPIPRGEDTTSTLAMRVVINQQKAGREVSLLRQRDRWMIAREDIIALKLPLPDLATIAVDGKDYLVVDSLWPYTVKIDSVWNLLSFDTASSDGSEPIEETWVELRVNESANGQLVQAYSDSKNRFFLSDDTLQTFRLKTPQASLVGEQPHALQSLPYVTPVFDSQTQSLSLYAQAEAFQASRVAGGYDSFVEPDFGPGGALLNYSLFGSHSDGNDQLSGYFELGAFFGRSFVSSQHLARNITQDDSETIRLESNLRIDWPEQMRSLIIGDTLNEAGAWGRPARFGGIKWGTNFSTQPAFITFPTEQIAGDTVVPSTVDVFINNARRSSASVEPGPFAISEVPTITGAGQMRVVMRDLFGRETIVSRPFYASSQLLKPGLHEYSYELGVLRKEFTKASNQYATGFASGTHRYGFTPWLTGELRAEASAESQGMGLATNVVWPAIAEFDLAVAASRDEENRHGELASIGLRRQANRFSFGARTTWRSPYFSQLGVDPDSPIERRESSAFAALGMGNAGNLSISHVQRHQRDGEDTEFATLQYTVSLWRNAHLRLSYLEPLNGELERSAAASISFALGQRTSGSVSTNQRSSGSSERIDVRQNVPAGTGFGYQVAAESGELDRLEAGTIWRSQAGLMNAQFGQLGSRKEYRASFDGGLAFLEGRPYVSQRLDQSFALVEVADTEGVAIYRDNQHLATTNQYGKALVPGLRDYQPNRIRLGDTQLPLDVEVASLERTVIPAYRHGVSLSFAIKQARWVSFQLLDSQGGLLPRGAQLVHSTTGAQTILGDEGRGYLELDPGTHSLQAWWQGNHCTFTLLVTTPVETLPDLGPATCR